MIYHVLSDLSQIHHRFPFFIHLVSITRYANLLLIISLFPLSDRFHFCFVRTSSSIFVMQSTNYCVDSDRFSWYLSLLNGLFCFLYPLNWFNLAAYRVWPRF